MSADNCIAILHTKEKFKVTDYCDGIPYAWENLRDTPVDTWRVVHTQAIDNFDWYEKHQPYMIGHYMVTVWGHSKIFYNQEDARVYARELLDNAVYVEYGIVYIDATKYDISTF